MQHRNGTGNINRHPQLEIATLGRFGVRCGDILLSEKAKRSYRLWDLFRFLITFRDRGSPPELIAETLWPDHEYEDPTGAVRTMVYRLRRLLTEKSGCTETDFITFHQGGYQWNTKVNYRLDADEFERLCMQAAQVAAAKHTEQAIDLYHQALSMYKGEYLPESSHHEWAIPVRHRYHRIYLKALAEMILLLKGARRHGEIITICERAFDVEPLEEEIHLAFLEALMATGRQKQARAHYEYITSALYRELGVKPSAAMRSLYQRMRDDQPGMELDLSIIQESLREQQQAEGAFLCDPATFRSLYKLETRRGERSGQAVFLVLLTLTGPDFEPPHPAILRPAVRELEDLLVKNLRKGDIVSQWNEAQFLIIMPGLNMEHAEMVLRRIKNSIDPDSHISTLTLHTKLQSLLPLGVLGNH